MQHIESEAATQHSYFDGAVLVREFNFTNPIINDAEIAVTDRYPLEHFAVNDISTALITVESGEGTILQPGEEGRKLEIGERILIAPGEPYALLGLASVAIRYTATPAWTVEQARIVEG